MAFKRLNDLRLVEEYCTKSENEKCPINQTCYDNEFQCRYWKQIFKQPNEEGFTIRQGNSWYKESR